MPEHYLLSYPSTAEHMRAGAIGVDGDGSKLPACRQWRG